MQWGPTFIVTYIHIGLHLHQELNHFKVIIDTGLKKGQKTSSYLYIDTYKTKQWGNFVNKITKFLFSFYIKGVRKYLKVIDTDNINNYH